MWEIPAFHFHKKKKHKQNWIQKIGTIKKYANITIVKTSFQKLKWKLKRLTVLFLYLSGMAGHEDTLN
jgi:hypothetical protein